MKRISILSLLLLSTAVHAVDATIADLWIKKMEFGTSDQRVAVIDSIEDADDAEDYYVFIESALKYDESIDVRQTAVYSLIRLKVDTEETWLYALTNEQDTDTLRMVIYGIGQLEISNAGEALFERLPEILDDIDDDNLSAAALTSIGEIGYTEASAYCLGVMTNLIYEDNVRAKAAYALSYIGSEEEVLMMENTVDNPGEPTSLRMYAAYAMGKLGGEDAFPTLKAIIEDEDVSIYIRQWALSGIAFTQSDEVYDLLYTFALNDTATIRAQAVEALGDFGSEDAIDLLMFKYEYDEDDDVQEAAADALLKLGIDVDAEDEEETESDE